MSSSERPITSKSRGICKYYTTPRGCFAGSQCKFLHGDPEHHNSREPKPLLTPYDESKRCRYYAKGFCRRGEQCWFKHIADDLPSPLNNAGNQDEDQQNEPCSICFEMPVTYGLLSGCSHIFCITWRDQKGQIEHGTIKKCPMCREPSKFITPSSRFWKHGHPEKERVTAAYKESMARVPCRHFQRSCQKDKTRPLCPFGKDCFYQHLRDDGTPFVFENGVDVCMRQYYATMRPSMRLMFDDFMDLTSEFLPLTVNVLQEAMESLESVVSASDDTVARTLNMVRLLVRREAHNSVEPEHSVEVNRVLESDPMEQSQERPAPPQGDDQLLLSSPSAVLGDLANRNDNFYDMPGLQTVSNSSSSEAYASDSESESEDDISRLGRYIRGTATREARATVDHPESEDEEDEEVRLRMLERGSEDQRTTLDDGDEPQMRMPITNYEDLEVEDGMGETQERHDGRVANPPFLTDGRGRVVWSGHGETSDLADAEARPSEEPAGGTTGCPGRNKVTR